MPNSSPTWLAALRADLGKQVTIREDCDGPCVQTGPESSLEVLRWLRDHETTRFEMLVDLAGVDYAEYGLSEWPTDTPAATGFSRGVHEATSARYSFDEPHPGADQPQRFAVVYHLLSLSHNLRTRVAVRGLGEHPPVTPSAIELWPNADWYEREAFDMFGIVFDGHRDLRRLLTDYGFIGHPLRKDFPLIGHMEVRYDPQLRRVIYQPVTIEPRVGVPKVRRETP